eukprot:GDKI01030781.1.p1 GENE.GDKI01030781.1~~GDKI01030781.1.p1  ORF type:complete len:403 (+),score=139.35 GDKI01030781.1:53-1261(+)
MGNNIPKSLEELQALVPDPAASEGPTIYKAELLVDCRNELGESPVWNAEQQTLYWVDIDGKKVLSYNFESKETSEYPMPNKPGCIGLVWESNDLLVCLEDGPVVYDPKKRAIKERLGDFEPNVANTRMNDGRMDRAGCMVVGGYNEKHREDKKHSSGVYCINPDTRDMTPLKGFDRGVRCANAICFSPDGQYMYFCDSPTKELLRYDYDMVTRSVSNPKTVMKLKDEAPGQLDGAVVDAQGYIWTAFFGGGKVLRLTPTGRLDMVVEVPVPNPTCPCFGGPDMDTLFITTTRKRMSEEQLAQQPEAGGVYAFKLPSLIDEAGFAEVNVTKMIGRDPSVIRGLLDHRFGQPAGVSAPTTPAPKNPTVAVSDSGVPATVVGNPTVLDSRRSSALSSNKKGEHAV